MDQWRTRPSETRGSSERNDSSNPGEQSQDDKKDEFVLPSVT